jgi:hypothetical protein
MPQVEHRLSTAVKGGAMREAHAALLPATLELVFAEKF